MFEGSRLFITHYEIPELREIQRIEARDRADYAYHTSQLNGGMGQLDQLF